MTKADRIGTHVFEIKKQNIRYMYYVKENEISDAIKLSRQGKPMSTLHNLI